MASVLLIYPEPEEDKYPRFGFSLNLLYLASLIKNSGHDILKYMDYSLEYYSLDEFVLYVAQSDFIIVELDSFSLKRSSNIKSGEYIIKKIKKDFPSKIVIAFGYDLSLFPRTVTKADHSLTSNLVEYKILKILNNERTYLDINYNLDNDSFDKLTFPDRSLLSNFIEHGGSHSHSANLKRSTLIQTSRGCLNTCTFCQRKGWHKKYISHSVDYVLSEFRYLQENNYQNIWISDDNFTFDLNRSKNILNGLIDEGTSKNMKISCSSWTKIDKEFLDLAKLANISIISFGIESANEEILRFYKKKIDLEKVQTLIDHANSIGLYTIGSFIIGAPMETRHTIKNTFDYALQTPFDQVNIKTLDYMAGSDLFDSLPWEIKKNKRNIFACRENGLNKFWLSELRYETQSFKKFFNHSKKKILACKMKLFGPPYNLLS
jgi:anaerobic magnesium-protoporphyrin IX monomethyl ester cyclase